MSSSGRSDPGIKSELFKSLTILLEELLLLLLITGEHEISDTLWQGEASNTILKLVTMESLKVEGGGEKRILLFVQEAFFIITLVTDISSVTGSKYLFTDEEMPWYNSVLERGVGGKCSMAEPLETMAVEGGLELLERVRERRRVVS